MISEADLYQTLQDGGLPARRMLDALEKYESERSLIHFFELCWPWFDPAPLEINWHHEAIAEHLGAVSQGQIRRLLINIPPRTGKTLLTSVAYPAWTWIQSQKTPLTGPQVRFLFVCYAATLSVEIATTARRLILCDGFQRLWGDRVKLLADESSRARFANTAGGYRHSASIEGGMIGRGGDIKICFPADEIIWTEFGPRPIGEVVRNREAARVWSYNEGRRQFELRSIVGWHRNPGARLIRIVTDRGGFSCTEDHLILTTAGYVEAAKLCSRDTLIGRHFADFVASASAVGIERQIEMSPCTSATDIVDRTDTHAISVCERAAGLGAKGNLSHDFVGEDAGAILERPVLFAVGDVLSARPVLQARERGLGAIAEDVSNLLPFGAWSEKSQGDEPVDFPVESLVVTPQRHARIAVGDRGSHELSLEPLTHRISSGEAADVAQIGNLVAAFEFNDRKPAFVRVLRVEQIHDVPSATYCITVEHNHNMVVGQAYITASNCDDPHKVSDVESELERMSVLRAYDEAFATRVIDPRTTAEIVIMQRLHEDDLSGHILTESIGDWDHLMIPMQYDPQRYIETSIGWSDPRRDMGEGALLWPTRFDDDWVDREQRRMGSVAWSGQMQQAPIGRGTEIIKPEWWQLWSAAEFPEYGTCVAALDTAYKEKESADYNALTVWAGFEHPETLKPKLMLRDAWQKRLNLADLVKAVIETCRKHKVERLLIEDASRGIDVQSEIWRLIGHREFRVQLVPVKGDKVARLNACVPVFENGVVYAPDRDWAQMVIDQVASFPRGRHDDLCFVAGTLIATRKGNIPIEFLKTNDEVLTPIGWCFIKAVNCMGWKEVVTRSGLTGTLGHPIFTRDAGFIALDSVAIASKLVRLKLCDLIRLILPKPWSLWAHSTGSWAGSEGITSLNRPRTQDGKTLKVSMWPSGNMPLVRKCLQAMRCITETMIRSISMLIIWSAYRRISIVGTLRTMIGKSRSCILRASEDWRRIGIEALRVALGTRNMSQKVWANAEVHQSEFEGKWRVSGVGRFLVSRHQIAGFAPSHVPSNIQDGATDNCALSIPTLRPVYNLTVEGACGYFANGILVHNCDSTALSIMYLRETGVAVRREEHDLAFTESRMYRKPARPLYDV